MIFQGKSLCSALVLGTALLLFPTQDTNAQDASLAVTVVSDGVGSSNFGQFALLTVNGPSGNFVRFVSIGSTTHFSDLLAGTYNIEARDFGAIIDAPREGSAVVTVGPGQQAGVVVELEFVPTIFIPPFFLPLF